MIIKKTSQPGKLFGLDETKQIKIYNIFLETGKSVGAHVTKNCEETILVLQGQAIVDLEGESSKIESGHAVYIPPEKKHNVRNLGDQPLHYIAFVSMINR